MSTIASRLHNPRTGAFWGQMSETEHAVQVYRDDNTFLDSLESFVASGLRSGESVILIATATHLHEVEKRLRVGWVDLDPTNNITPGEEHITVAYGRDFHDVSPLAGIITGGGQHVVKVGVDVAPVAG